MVEIVRVELGSRSYDIHIATDAFGELGTAMTDWWTNQFAGANQPRALVVCDQNVAGHYLATATESLRTGGWEVSTATIPPGEETKCVAQLESLYDHLVEMSADRRTVVVALGGGVTGDLSGFAAATFARGVPFVQIPTTLLAQVDSSVGGKTGVNHPRGKNLIGAFHQPLGVYIDTQTLATLPPRDFRSGLAEVVKYGLIMDAAFFEWLEQNVQAVAAGEAAAMRYIVKRCCELKAEVVAEDEFETTERRAILNYGHTYAHAFEALSDYSRLLHGEAVAVGMVCAGRLARELGRVDATFCARQESLLAAVGLPVSLPEGCSFSPEEVVARMRLDKKAVAGQLRFVLPARIGHVEVVADVPEGLVIGSLG